MAKAGVCLDLVLTTEASARVEVLRPWGFKGQAWGVPGRKEEERMQLRRAAGPREVFEMGADLAGKRGRPQSDDRIGNPLPKHSLENTSPPCPLHLQAPPEPAWQAGSEVGVLLS